MLPVVRGEAETARQIVLYTIALVAVSLLLLPAAGMGWIYLVAAVVLGGLFLWRALRLRADAADGRAAISLFRYSITYLTLLFAAVAVDALLHRSRLRAERAASTVPRRGPRAPRPAARRAGRCAGPRGASRATTTSTIPARKRRRRRPT